MAVTTLPKLIALIVLLAAGGAALLLSGALGPLPAWGQTIIDYDANDNGLIDVSNLDQFNAMRWDPDGNGDPVAANTSSYLAAFPDRDTAASTRMGCPSGTCAGYELMADLTFPEETSSPHNPFWPIGNSSDQFNTVFDGNGRTITGLTTPNQSLADGGLFGVLGGSGVIRNLGVIDPEVYNAGSQGTAGGLVGEVLSGGVVSASYVSGGTVTAWANSIHIGGLVGDSQGAIRASYATATVNRTSTWGLSTHYGGLVGRLQASGSIIASYAAGPVHPAGGANNRIGGLVGDRNSSATITDSYFDNQISTQSNGAGSGGNAGITGYNTADLQGGFGYAGIYAYWNIDLDGDGNADFPWQITAGQYPTHTPPAQRQALANPDPTDYDANDNGLIDISTALQLDAMRHDPDGDGSPHSNTSTYNIAFPGRFTTSTTLMGCPSGTCTGYELTADLTFATSSRWAPIGGFDTTLDGAGHSITGININIGATGGDAGMFSGITADAVIRDLGLIDFSVTSTKSNAAASNGILAGWVNVAATISNVYVQGGRISVSTNFANANVGGLVGYYSGSITASYSTAAVTMTGSEVSRHAGGLVGRCEGCTITASYAAGPVTSTAAALNNIGGLTGRVNLAAATITDSYCDTDATGQSDCDGNVASPATATAAGYTTAQLQAPTDYAGIYSHWNVDQDGDLVPDHPWNFGASNEYPTLNSPAQRATLAAAVPPADYDVNNNNLIDISAVAQLYALRYDPDGDGNPETANAGYYGTVFPGRTTSTPGRMGCPAACAGYELTADLMAPAATGGPYNPWPPIGGFGTTLDGAGHTITGININISEGDTGLFGDITASAVIRDLGLVNFNATTTRPSSAGSNGILAGYVPNAATISRVSVQGGSLHVTTNVNDTSAGGLVGYYGGTITASYSTAAVTMTGSEVSRHAGGLVGRCIGCTITASYAAGPVTSTAALTNLGGLTGNVDQSSSAINHSYCDTDATGQSDCDGSATNNASATAAGYTTAQLQTPTDYAGIYSHWNVDQDGDLVPDHPWNFGAAGQYPTLNSPAQRATLAAAVPPADYDVNNNNLIDISAVAQLYAMRYDLDGDGNPTAANAGYYGTVFPGRTTSTPGRMGCPDTCAGYELTADLTAPTATGGPYNPWPPIGGFGTTLDGAGHTITGVNINIGATGGDAGMFSGMTADAVIRDLGLIDFSVTSTKSNAAASNGILAGYVPNAATISNVYVQGGRISVSTDVADANVGGLVGIYSGTITASYSTAAVNMTGSQTGRHAGGLVGRCVGCTITASYAAGPVTSTAALSNLGGLTGNVDGASSVINHSYCDTEGTGQSDCDGSATDNATASAAGHGTSAMQTPTGYTGIYLRWNLDPDGNGHPNYPWNFGTTTTYPTLNTPEQRTAAAPAATDHDVNDNNLIDVSTLAQLNAMRWDLNGDGDPDAAADALPYTTAFGGRTTSTPGRMGCPGTCLGYELSASLTFPTSTGAYNPWTPVGDDTTPFNTIFDGRGRTLTGMSVTGTMSRAGLFGTTGASSVIRDLGMINATVAAGGAAHSGVIAGQNAGLISASYASGGSVLAAVTAAQAGGLVGSDNAGTIIASYSTATVNITSGQSVIAGGLAGGLYGSQVTASYAAGPVSGMEGSAANVGGFAGLAQGTSTRITASYCDSGVTTRSACIGATTTVQQANLSATAASATTLQTPTGYAGIYINWNVDLDGNGAPDYPWNFGAANEYPMLNSPEQRRALAPDPVDYDANDNNLIDIDNLDQLNAIRWDANGDGNPESSAVAYSTAFPGRVASAPGRMGCPAACAGYELRQDLNFDSDNSGSVDAGDAFAGNWPPIPAYSSVLDGNGYVLRNLTINRTGASIALFAQLNSGGRIRDLGLVNPDIDGGGVQQGQVAALVANNLGAIDASYVSGGTVDALAAGTSTRLGGLAGQNGGAIRAAYATAALATAAPNAFVGGLVGNLDGGTITAGYAAGSISATGGSGPQAGGLVGRATGLAAVVHNSYCDTTVRGGNCVGRTWSSSPAAAAGLATTALQAPAGYTGIYTHWNLDLDGNGAPDYLWDFGAANQYPTLHTPTQRAELIPAPKDYDANDNNLIDIDSIAKLNAIRWDLNGDGDPDASGVRPGYGTVFAGRATSAPGRMGCPDGCIGYELTMSLSFPAETSSDYNPWTPVDQYAAEFNGQGYTLTGLNVDTASHAGLFNRLNNGARIRDVGLIEPQVKSTGLNTYSGALAGYAQAGSVIETSYVQGGAVTIAGSFGQSGGLAGRLDGTIRSSYSTVALRIADPCTCNNLYSGGLVGYMEGAAIVGSYAAATSTVTAANFDVGGLVGRAISIIARPTTITNSYCDTEQLPGTTAGHCVGDQSGLTLAANGQTTAALQTPTGYTGIYLNWNADLDNDLNLDYPWNFGNASQYPKLYTPTQRAQQIPANKDYDENDNNLIDITSLDELNAMRWDPNGDGDPETANFSAYGTVFAGRTAAATGRMGCPDGCQGYELRASLTFPAETTSNYNPWTPLDFAATFDGNGHTLANLNIAESGGDAGLFGTLNGPNGLIKNVGLLNPVVSTTGANQNTGALAGQVLTGAGIDASYVSGGSVTVSGYNARGGGLVGQNRGRIRATYATAAVSAAGDPISLSIGGLVGYNQAAEIVASYAAAPVSPGSGAVADGGGLVGTSDGTSEVITNSYCDREVAMLTTFNICIGALANSSPAVATAYPTAELQQPDDYTGIYQHWNLDLDNDPETQDPWVFARGSYPRLYHQGRAQTDSPPPGGPRVAQPPQDTPYNPASDHPEIYENDRHEMTATCNVQYNADGAPETSTITFNLGNYRGQVILHLAQWNGQYFTSYESLGIPMPTFERNGQTATVRVTTNPVNTRFLLDSISPTTNLVLGYADCHTDDHTGVLATPGAAAATETPTETATTSTPTDADDPAETAATSTPPTPKVYTNDRYEMTASCEVRNNAEGQPESSQITFDLGNYQGTVILSVSLWNGEYYASLESHNLPEPLLERNGQTATVQITTNPTETRFLLDGTPNGLRTNLLLGYADCHTAGE